MVSCASRRAVRAPCPPDAGSRTGATSARGAGGRSQQGTSRLRGRRSHAPIATFRAAATDPKLHRPPGTPWPVYVSRREDRARVAGSVKEVLDQKELGTIDVKEKTLPANLASIEEHGLLYLPRPYVVPGGRFNEMYGWDSYFIVLGLVALWTTRQLRRRHGRQLRLRGASTMVAIRNANRSYYLTRSQPPLLSAMVMALVRRWTGDRAWLRTTRDAILSPATNTGRAACTSIPEPRPVPLFRSRRGSGARSLSPASGTNTATAPLRSCARVFSRLKKKKKKKKKIFYNGWLDELTPEFYKADRAMRESGFDPTGRFGPFGADILHIAPVCLNTLLYRMEVDLARDRLRPWASDADAARWREAARRGAPGRASKRCCGTTAGRAIFRLRHGQSGRRRVYPFATTFWPLWAGLASPVTRALASWGPTGDVRTLAAASSPAPP